jgi:hypothetical protein
LVAAGDGADDDSVLLQCLQAPAGPALKKVHTVMRMQPARTLGQLPAGHGCAPIKLTQRCELPGRGAA